MKYLQIDKIWDEYGFKGKGILVGHLDTGVYEEHPDLRGKVDRWAFFDPLGRELSGFPPFDTQTHGTHTAGIIVGGNFCGVHIGVAPEAKLASAGMLVEKAELNQILAGMEWAIRHQVSVLSMSLGFTSYEPVFERFLNRLIAMDIFPSFAIGNEGLGNTKSPANSINAVGVGAIDSNEDVPDFSSGAIRETGKVISVRSLIDLIYKNVILRGDRGHNNRYGRGIINPLNTLREIV